MEATKFTQPALSVVAMLLLSGLCSRVCVADVVFDGSIGANPAGTIRSGLFEIAETDGQLIGNNLFHSFEQFNVSPGEVASFSHDSISLNNIIARVSGNTATNINGMLQIVFSNGGNPQLSSADFWLLNPNGVVIGDGASFSSAGAFKLSSANRLGFDNGEDFYSHELTVSSSLSIAQPSSFGFLDKQPLPTGVIPAGIMVEIVDPANLNAPMFIGDMTLIGTSIDDSIPGVSIIGDTDGFFAADAAALTNSSQIQSLSFDVLALGVATDGSGSSYTISAPISDTSNTALSDILLRNSNFLISDNGIASESSFSLTARNIGIENSQVDAFPVAIPTEVMLRAAANLNMLFSTIRTNATAAADAGSITIDATDYTQLGGLVGSQALTGFASGSLGRPGDIIVGSSVSIGQQSFALIDGDIFSTSSGQSSAGDIIIQAQQSVDILGQATGTPFFTSNVSTISNDGGDSGNIVLSSEAINLDFASLRSVGKNTEIDNPVVALLAGSGGLSVNNSSLQGSASFAGAGADILLDSGSDILINSIEQRSSIQSGTSGDADGGTVIIDATGDLTILGSHDIGSDSLGGAAALGSAGQIFLSGQNILLDATEGEPLIAGASNALVATATNSLGNAADVTVLAEQNLTIVGSYAFNSSTGGAGDAGILSLVGSDISINGSEPGSSGENTTSFFSVTGGSGDAGTIRVVASGSLDIRNAVSIATESFGLGAAGTVDLIANEISVFDTSLTTTTRSNNPSDIPATLTVRAVEDLQINASSLRATTVGEAPGGTIDLLSAGSLLLQDSSVQSGTFASGLAGNVNIFAGTDGVLQGFETEILTNSSGTSNGGDINLEAINLSVGDGTVIQAAATGSGDAGNIVSASNTLVIDQGEIETSAENGGGGNIELVANDSIRLDSAFLLASSASSSSDGSGGSINLGVPAAAVGSVLIKQSFLSASAIAGNGGQINISADFFLRDATTALLVTSETGAPGSLEINAPDQDISAAVANLDISILDASNLIRPACSMRGLATDQSSLSIMSRPLGSKPDGYRASGPVSSKVNFEVYEPSAARVEGLLAIEEPGDRLLTYLKCVSSQL